EFFFFERQGDACVQPLTLSSQQGAISRVLDQCMLEEIAPLRWRAALEDKTSADKLIECHLQFRLGPLRDGGEKLVGKFASHRSANLCRLLGRGTEPVEPRHQRGAQGCWHGELR